MICKKEKEINSKALNMQAHASVAGTPPLSIPPINNVQKNYIYTLES